MRIQGSAPLKISSTVMDSPRLAFIAKTTMPNGGVTSPISMVMTETTANQKGSNPMAWMTG